jgi:threonine dehydratase
MIPLLDFQAAAERIRGHVRRTPLLAAAPLREPVAAGDLTLKLESLQVTGSFKARGAAHKVLTLSPEELARGLVTASGGNHGLGVAYAGRLAGAKVTIYLPANAPASKAERLKAWGAEVVREGAVWDDANAVALEAAERHGWTYVHAFADPAIIAGQGTISLEILEDAPETGLLVVSIGGGGLIAGVAAAAKALKPGIRVIGVEPTGAPTLYESVKAGRVIELPEIRTVANTLAPRKSDALNLAIIQETVDEIVLVTDDEMRAAARQLWFETGIAAELSGAAALAALRTGKIQTAAGESVCAVICGAGVDGIEPP